MENPKFRFSFAFRFMTFSILLYSAFLVLIYTVVSQQLAEKGSDISSLILFCIVVSFLFTSAWGFLMAQKIVSPIKLLIEKTKQISMGHWKEKLTISQNDEFADLGRALNRMTEILQATTVSKDYVNNIIRCLNDSLIVLSLKLKVQAVNPGTCALLGYKEEEVLSQSFQKIFKNFHLFEGRNLEDFFEKERITNREEVYISKNNEEIPILFSASVLTDNKGEAQGIVCMAQDIRKQVQMQEEKIALERQLTQGHKMEAIGTLAAGIAHEINTPIQFIGGNLHFLLESFGNYDSIIEAYTQLIESSKDMSETELKEKVIEIEKDMDLPYLQKEIPDALKQSQEGVDRVVKIVNAMKDFSHVGYEKKVLIDINQAIEGMKTISINEWKYTAEMDLQLDAGLPEVPCLVGEIKQVILNLVVNAAHAIKDKGDKEEMGKITIKSFQEEGDVVIAITDSGCGIPEDIQTRIFDPFFTTKEVGVGTGQGLSLAYGIVVDRHGGKIWFDTKVGEGTTFYVSLPIEEKEGLKMDETSESEQVG